MSADDLLAWTAGWADPGPLIGTGRAALVYDLGGDRVLRRYRVARRPGLTEREAAVMAHLRRHGYPVPEVFDADGADLVMERLHGTTMLGDLESHPWRMRPPRRHVGRAAPASGERAGGRPGDAGVPVALRCARRRAAPRLPPGQHHADAGRSDGLRLVRTPRSARRRPTSPSRGSSPLRRRSTAHGGCGASSGVLRRRFVDRFLDGCGRADARSRSCPRRRLPAHRPERPARGGRPHPRPPRRPSPIRAFTPIRCRSRCDPDRTRKSRSGGRATGTWRGAAGAAHDRRPCPRPSCSSRRRSSGERRSR